MLNKPFLISTSITDLLPLHTSIETDFKNIKQTGVDGVEIVLGTKTRWKIDEILEYSKKYDLPVTSVHQPMWSGLAVRFDDKGFIEAAKKLGTTMIVFHALPFISLQSSIMRKYFKHLATLQKECDITVMLENGSPRIFNTYVPFYHSSSYHILDIFSVAEEYDFKMTLDISHEESPNPHEQDWFAKILPKIANIHLSSFDKTREHLPLDKGIFQVKSFLSYLQNNNYKNLLTFEIFYPGALGFRCDYEAIKRSVEIVKSVK